MPNPSSKSLTFYPAYCLLLSPTYNTWARVTAADVLDLRERAGYEGQHIYFHLNHPIRWIRLIGVIVAVDYVYNRWIAQLDDSCGASIELICTLQAPVAAATGIATDALNPAASMKDDENLQRDNMDGGKRGHIGVSAMGHTIDLSGVDVGAVVKVKGGIGEFRGQKQITLERIALIRTTTDEAAGWAETSTFRRNILSTPWVIDEREMKHATRKAEGLDRHRRIREEQKVRKRKLGSKPRHSDIGDKQEHHRENEGELEKDQLRTMQRRERWQSPTPEGIFMRDVNISKGLVSKPTHSELKEKRKQHRAKQKEPQKNGEPRTRQRWEGTTSERISGRDVRIPKDQQALLDSVGSWLPAASPRNATVPVLARQIPTVGDPPRAARNSQTPPCDVTVGRYDALGL